MELDIASFVFVLAMMSGLAVVMGKWLAYAFEDEQHWLPERWSYRALGVQPDERMGWARYGLVLLLSNAAMMGLGYLLLRWQGWLPLNELGNAAQTPDLAFNTAASFITNTNWQAYGGETSLSNATQMLAITFLMFCGATAGVAAAGAFIRGLARASSQDIGNYWVDFMRVLWHWFMSGKGCRKRWPVRPWPPHWRVRVSRSSSARWRALRRSNTLAPTVAAFSA